MEITIVHPHQLFARHPAITKDRPVWLIEDPLFFGNDTRWPLAIHKQKLMLHRASMTAYAAELAAAGHKVSHTGAREQVVLPRDLRAIHAADPADAVLSRRLARLAESRGAALVIHESPNFLSPPEFLEARLASRRKPFMAAFYEAQRKRMGILLEPDGSPCGGKWSFDTENRERLPRGHQPPAEPRCPANEFTREAAAYVNRNFPDNPGTTDGFRWPVTRRDAEQWLARFIRERLAFFGTYEDAIATGHATLYHSAITPALNTGLLDPRDVVDRVLATDAPLNSKEGFIRQVIGWREFMHGIYRHHGTRIRNGNFWNFTRPLPDAFLTASTGIPPVDRVIRQVLADGWCHHIERLMVLGNFMLLCRIRPDDVYRWFMRMFVDAYDWVMVPNVYGMSQFADGGTFTTKPYLSGSNYILRMSDEAKGPWCATWDGLFWTFIGDHLPFFLKNPRLSMMARTWEKLAPEKKDAHRRAADAFLARLDAGRHPPS
jgi:deoxyribodipyrimidine photolyase-related protein